MRNPYKHLSVLFTIFSLQLNAQMGINTDVPKTTLDIREVRENLINNSAIADGLLIPRLSKKELASKNKSVYSSNSVGAKVYVNDISGIITGPSENQVININEKGFYFFNSNLVWEKLTSDLTDDAWINNPTENRIELGTNSLGNNRLNNSNVVISDEGFLGINNINPIKRLDIDASTPDNITDHIKISNLKIVQPTEITSTLVIDDDGNIYKNDVENLNGQIMRIPIVGFLKGGSDNTDRQGSLRLGFDNNSLSPACTTNVCNKNFINYIKGVTENHLLRNKTLPAGTGTNIRTTDRITLPKGTYKVQVRLVGHYTISFTPSPSEQSTTAYSPGTTILKLAIGNNEFSLSNYQDSTYGDNSLTSILYSEFIVLDSDDDENRTLDFLMDPSIRPFTIIPYTTYNNGTVIKSMVLIERIR